MKKTLLLTIIAFLVLIPVVSGTVVPEIIDQYDIAFGDSDLNLEANHPSAGADYSAIGQSFTAPDNLFLTRVDFYLSKNAAPNGNTSATLYAHAGVFGTTGVPTGNVLAYSNEFDITQLTGSILRYEFDFNYDQQFALVSGTSYFIVFRAPVAGVVSNVNFPEVEVDSNGAHAGNTARFSAGAWSVYTNRDVPFVLYAADQPYVAQDTLQFEADIFRWVNVTARNGTGIAGFSTVDITVNTTGDAESFTLRWTQATGVFSEVADSNFTAVIDAVRSFTTVLDTNTSVIRFRFKMDNATTGECDVLTNGTNDDGGFLEFLQLNEFNYAGLSWTAVGDAINSAFEFFGISGFMTNLTTYINGFTSWFTVSLTNLLLMITQQMRLVLQIFFSFVGVFTRMTTTLLTVWNFLYSIFDGSGIIVTGVGNVWDFIAFDLWVDFFYIAVLIWWIQSIERRGRTQGEINVFLGDVQTAINLSSYFISTFSFIINEVINKVLILFDAVTGVIPI